MYTSNLGSFDVYVVETIDDKEVDASTLNAPRNAPPNALLHAPLNAPFYRWGFYAGIIFIW